MFLLTGGNGQLGTELRHLLDEKKSAICFNRCKRLGYHRC